MTQGETVNCSITSLTTVPLIHLTDVRLLYLFENNITFFERDSFASLTELELLIVLLCGLRTIELGAFNGLTKLTYLSISMNYICDIPCTFENMTNLEYLDLSYNRIEHVESAVFSRLVNLKYIGLQGNSLQYLHPDTFLGLPNIQQLYFSNNLRLQIPNGRNFIKSHSLSRLDVSRYNISSLSVETFANVSALNSLDLSYNNLSTVDINILTALPKLSALYLHSIRYSMTVSCRKCGDGVRIIT